MASTSPWDRGGNTDKAYPHSHDGRVLGDMWEELQQHACSRKYSCFPRGTNHTVSYLPSWPSTLGTLTQPNTIEYQKQRTAPQAPKGGRVSMAHTTAALRQDHSPMVGTMLGQSPFRRVTELFARAEVLQLHTFVLCTLDEHATP